MKIYIWEGNGISEAYHDDGTLVVLAESPEQARQIVRDEIEQRRLRDEADAPAIAAHNRKVHQALQTVPEPRTHEEYRKFWQSDEGKALLEEAEQWKYDDPTIFDGSDDALNREPDRIVEIDKPTWVAFNGGGYD